MLNIAVCVSGGGTDLQSVIDAVEAGSINGTIKLVISNRKKAYALERAKKHGIKAEVIKDQKDVLRRLEEEHIDLVVLAGYLAKRGVRVSGCTVHFVSSEVDGGPIILQKAVDITDVKSPEEIQERVLVEEHKILPQAVALFCDGKLAVVNERVEIKK